MNTLSHPALCSRMPAYLGQVIHRRHVKGDLAFDFSGIILRLEERVELAILRAAVAAVLRKYETLRLAFRRCPETGWFPHVHDGMVGEPVDDLCYAVDLSGLPEEARSERVEMLAQGIASDIDPFSARPLLRVVMFRLGTADDRLLIAIHHFVCDGLSTQMVWRDITRFYRALKDGEQPSFDAERGSITRFVDYLGALTRRQTVDSLRYWLQRPRRMVEVPGCPGQASFLSTWSQSVTCRGRLRPRQFSGFREAAARRYRCSVADLLLAAYVYVLGEWLGTGWVAVANWTTAHLAGKGLYPVEHLVGYFAFPVFTYFHLDCNRSFGDTVEHARRQQLTAIGNALDFAACRFMEHPPGAALPPEAVEVSNLPMPLITFCYMGEFSDPAEHVKHQVAEERLKSYMNEESEKYTLLDCDIDVSGGELFVDVNYPAELPATGQMAAFAARYLQLLERVCLEAAGGERRGENAGGAAAP
ncbi:hypothetical protein D3093_32685 (plasmid) [Azospirillum argentinense]|uniref:Condensation domain-containing protein n=1 Tax=Azospirillum argentinense TaxID=2970906 RepID=A0A4D8PX54_9PROT|nr:condensation domain-containing protein [Azospirillum argentinense]QCO00026.1 hypothetical protein D3093_32685 [Azospirillum argentinense]